jgi:hypothetical protein
VGFVSKLLKESLNKMVYSRDMVSLDFVMMKSMSKPCLAINGNWMSSVQIVESSSTISGQSYIFGKLEITQSPSGFLNRPPAAAASPWSSF